MSNQMVRTYATKPNGAIRFWHKNGMKPPRVRVLDVLLRRIRYLLAEVPPAPQGRVLCADSRVAVGGLAFLRQAPFLALVFS